MEEKLEEVLPTCCLLSSSLSVLFLCKQNEAITITIIIYIMNII